MELSNINVDYYRHRVEVVLVEREKKYIIIFDCVQMFSVEIFEPWGSGVYVSEVRVITSDIEELVKLNKESVIDEEAFLIEILLNSGDKISIISTAINYIVPNKLKSI